MNASARTSILLTTSSFRRTFTTISRDGKTRIGAKCSSPIAPPSSHISLPSSHISPPSSHISPPSSHISLPSSHIWPPSRRFHAVARDVLLFKDDRTVFYRVLSFGATLIGFAAFYNGLTFFKSSAAMARRFDVAKSTVELDESTWWKRYKARLYRFVSGDKIRYGVTAFMMAFGGLSLFGAVVIPIRMVHRMSLLSGGHRVSITTFGPYGFIRNHDFRVDDVTATVARKSYYSSIPINVKGVYPGFRMDNQNGKFLNTELFDDVVSVQKIFKK